MSLDEYTKRMIKSELKYAVKFDDWDFFETFNEKMKSNLVGTDTDSVFIDKDLDGIYTIYQVPLCHLLARVAVNNKQIVVDKRTEIGEERVKYKYHLHTRFNKYNSVGEEITFTEKKIRQENKAFGYDNNWTGLEDWVIEENVLTELYTDDPVVIVRDIITQLSKNGVSYGDMVVISNFEMFEKLAEEFEQLDEFMDVLKLEEVERDNYTYITPSLQVDGVRVYPSSLLEDTEVWGISSSDHAWAVHHDLHRFVSMNKEHIVKCSYNEQDI